MEFLKFALASLTVLTLFACKKREFNASKTSSSENSSDAGGAQLECHGTEPFWNLSILGSTGKMKSLDGTNRTFAKIVKRGFAGRLMESGYVLENGEFQAVVKRETCSDGMSDDHYPFSVTYSGDVVLSGCCSEKPIEQQEEYVCSGTEPFWSLAISSGGATLKNLGENSATSIAVTQARHAAGKQEEFLTVFDLNEQGSNGHAIIKREKCSDGMSENDFPYSVLFSSKSVFSGCCKRK